MQKRLTDDSRKYLVRQREKGTGPAQIGRDLGISARHVRRLWARFQKTGIKMGRPRLYARDTPCNGIIQKAPFRDLKKSGVVEASAAKSKKRKWVRYERTYSNAMWHVDWHTMKEPRFRGLCLVTYLDDASRCIVAAQIFTQATSENAVLVLRKAIAKFGTPPQYSDNGSCFVGGCRGRKALPKSGSWKPTAFEAELLNRGIDLINSCSQRTSKLGRLHRSIEEAVVHSESLSEYMEYYKEQATALFP